MKIALCLSGQSRNWQPTFNSIYNNIIRKYNCDVFIHTWNYNTRHVPHEYDKSYTIFDEYLKLDYDFLYQYNPKKTQLEFPNYDYFRKLSTVDTRFYNTIMMWYSINKCNLLRKEYEFENEFKYDCIIRCRTDLFIHHFEINELKKNTIYLPPNQNTDVTFRGEMKKLFEEKGIRYMPNDQLAYGDDLSINYYSSVYDTIKKDINLYEKHPEGLFTDHLFNLNKEDILCEVNNNIKIRIQR